MSYGPNVTKLLTKYIGRCAIPKGGGFADGIEFITNPERRAQVLAKAEEEMLMAIKLIKATSDNPYGNDDELIAGAILAKLEEVKKK